jgi:hypothetical protein
LVSIGLIVPEEKIFEKAYDGRTPTYGKIAGFWIITQKPLMISEI